MLWIEAGRALAESSSVIRTADYLGGWWSCIGNLASLCPSSLLNSVYRLIATNRLRFISSPQNCLVPPPEQRSRFLVWPFHCVLQSPTEFVAASPALELQSLPSSWSRRKPIQRRATTLCALWRHYRRLYAVISRGPSAPD